MTSRQSTNARVFRQLHGDGLLVLPNAWDAEGEWSYATINALLAER